MIINQEGMRYTYNGMTYTVGAAVMATEASEYRGLYGTITEIRDGSDRETENDTPDIYCCFEPPLFQEEIRELERRFTELYQSPKKLDEITLDGYHGIGDGSGDLASSLGVQDMQGLAPHNAVYHKLGFGLHYRAVRRL